MYNKYYWCVEIILPSLFQYANLMYFLEYRLAGKSAVQFLKIFCTPFSYRTEFYSIKVEGIFGS